MERSTIHSSAFEEKHGVSDVDSSRKSIRSQGNQEPISKQEKDVHLTDADGQNGPDADEEEEEEEGEVAETQGADAERVVSKQPSVNNAAAIPNGGLKAWLQVAGAFFLFFNSWGIVNTFGSYQTYYESDMLRSSTPSAISWIGSIQAFLLLLVGALTGPIYDAGYFRALLFLGSFLIVLGQMMLSICHEYWQVLLAQAFCIGIGCGCLFVPSVAILATYFTTKVAFAMGIAASGSSLGGVVYPIVFHKLLPQIGFGWSTRTIGFLMIATQLIPNLCMKVRVLPAKSRSLLDLAAFKLPPYALSVLGFSIGFMGLYMPFFYGQVYALDKHITNSNMAFYLLAIMNASSIFGRIIPNYLADKMGALNVVIPCTFISGILSFCFIPIHNEAGLLVLMVLYGFFSGCFVSIPPTIIVLLSSDARDKIGTRMGQSFACIACGLLIGTPVGGAILDSSGFSRVWTFGGSLMFGAGIVLCVGRVFYKGFGLLVKA